MMLEEVGNFCKIFYFFNFFFGKPLGRVMGNNFRNRLVCDITDTFEIKNISLLRVN